MNAVPTISWALLALGLVRNRLIAMGIKAEEENGTALVNLDAAIATLASIPSVQPATPKPSTGAASEPINEAQPATRGVMVDADTSHLNCLEARRISPGYAICEPCNTGYPERCLYKRGSGAAGDAEYLSWVPRGVKEVDRG
jgi:hypothetical protein